MLDFQKAYDQLNNEQKQAVDHIYGPMLVVAGPGTGKTHLLTLRVANILLKTDISPSNILCLTFSESATSVLRTRLKSIIGNQANEIKINTYHGFGSEIIQQYPEFFKDLSLARPIDDIDTFAIVSDLLNKLPYTDPLKPYRYIPKEIINIIGQLKESLTDAAELETKAKQNIDFIDSMSVQTRKIFHGMVRVDKSSRKFFEQLLNRECEGELAKFFFESLSESLENTENTKQLTKWKNKWLKKDKDARFVVKGKFQHEKLLSLARLYRDYQLELAEKNLYDYQDMIHRVHQALDGFDELKYTLQEQFQFILLDEFQDTNMSQLEIINKLGDNPVLEGKPNIMAVGDDDQAIYTFQGADASYMLKFHEQFPSVKVVTLKNNYRSNSEIISFSTKISSEIEGRLANQIDIDKNFKSFHGDGASIIRANYKTDAEEYSGISSKIAELIRSGVEPKEIAVISPKHKFLEEITQYLKAKNLPVSYERRENILEKQEIIEIVDSLRLIDALNAKNYTLADSLYPSILSQEHYEVPLEAIWNFSWDNRKQRRHWSETILGDSKLKDIGKFFTKLALLSEKITIEEVIEYIIGRRELDGYTNPFLKFYKHDKSKLINLLSDINLLRYKAIDRSKSSGKPIFVHDFLDVIDSYTSAGIKVLNTHKYIQGNSGVQVLTAHKAKGLEFEHVFIVGMVDEIWGPSQRSNRSRFSLPPNLMYISNQNSTNDELLRLLYVAITRSKSSLVMSSHDSTLAGKQVHSLTFLNEKEEISPLLPEETQTIEQKDAKLDDFESIEPYWTKNHVNEIVNLPHLLKSRLDRYKMSPSHLNKFIDVVYAGPESFFIENILNFPGPNSPEMIYGSAIHSMIEWIHNYLINHGEPPSKQEVNDELERTLKRERLPQYEYELLMGRGRDCVNAILDQRLESFHKDNLHEDSFYGDNITMGDIRLTGNIDKLIVNKKDKTITIVDFKTGKHEDRWKSSIKLHKYKQQLYLYKYLVEHSPRFAGYSVEKAMIEFVEPNEEGNITVLELNFDYMTENKIQKLLQSVWKKIHSLEFPDVAYLPQNMTGVLKFEKELIEGE